LSGRPTECTYCQYPAPKGHCCGKFSGFLCMECIAILHIDTICRIRVNHPCAAVMRPYVNYFDHLLLKIAEFQ